MRYTRTLPGAPGIADRLALLVMRGCAILIRRADSAPVNFLGIPLDDESST